MASPTANSTFNQSIDFSQYGMNWVIDDTMTKLPTTFLDGISKVTQTGNNINILKPDGSTLNFNIIEELGRGTFGKSYLIDQQINGYDAIVKKIKLISSNEDFIYDILQEVLTQIIIYESTKDIDIPEIQLVGPFCPKFFCLGRANDSLYIVMEKLDVVLASIFMRSKKAPSTWQLPPVFKVQKIIQQLSKILEVLYRTLNFNHRDLKLDNVMYKNIGAKLNIRLIDFGFSCLTYKSLNLRSICKDFLPSKLTHCNSRSRDLHSFFFYLKIFSEYANVVCPINDIFNIILASDVTKPISWGNTYRKFNVFNDDSNPLRTKNLDMDVVYRIFTNLIFTTPTSPFSKFTSSWAKSLAYVDDDTVKHLTDEEYNQLEPSVVEPFIVKQVSANLRLFWAKNTDLNALITNYTYYIPELTRPLRKTPFTLPIALLPKIFTQHITTVLEQTDKLNETILHKIARNPDIPDIRSKLDKVLESPNVSIPLNIKNIRGETALDVALETNFTEAIEKIIKVGNFLDFFRHFPKIHYDTVLKILEKNSDWIMNIKSQMEYTMLHVLSSITIDEEKGQKLMDIVFAIPLSQTYIDSVNDQGFTAFELALEYNNVELINRFMKLNANVNPVKFLFNLIRVKDSTIINALTAKYYDKTKMDINSKDSIGNKTPLILGTFLNNINLVKKLIELGAKTALKDARGKTALHYAAENASRHEANAFDIVKILIEANPALPNIKNNSKKGPGNPEYVKNAEVRNYIKTRKSRWFCSQKKNTNKNKNGPNQCVL